MGAGKSTIAQKLDKKLKDFQYLDIDKEIEKLAKKHIEEIFALKGEAHFRKLEHEMIAKYAKILHIHYYSYVLKLFHVGCYSNVLFFEVQVL